MLSSYLRYVVKRKNEYRIHSPFVYALYTRVLCSGDDEALRSLGIERVEVVSEEKLPERDSAVMFEVENIHGNKKKEAFWNTICGCPDVTLTIDMYHKGLFFYRDGMEKQHFVLK